MRLVHLRWASQSRVVYLFTQYWVQDCHNFNTSVSLLTMRGQISLYSSHLFKMIKIPISIFFYQGLLLDIAVSTVFVLCIWACQGSYWLKSVFWLNFISAVVECAFWVTYWEACELFTLKTCACGQQGCVPFRIQLRMPFKFQFSSSI